MKVGRLSAARAGTGIAGEQVEELEKADFSGLFFVTGQSLLVGAPE